MPFTDSERRQAATVLASCRRAGVRLATAESCTGGLLAALLTEIAGSSDVVEAGIVTYSNGAKVRLLGVSPAILARHGAVSEPTARAMAEGALDRIDTADIALSITGIAGPGGATADKPVGLVHFALARRGDRTTATSRVFAGDRATVRHAAADEALRQIERAL